MNTSLSLARRNEPTIPAGSCRVSRLPRKHSGRDSFLDLVARGSLVARLSVPRRAYGFGGAHPKHANDLFDSGGSPNGHASESRATKSHERNGSRPAGAGLGCVGSFSRSKKCRVRKSARVESSPRDRWQRRNGGFPRASGFNPGNGQVVDPAQTHTSGSLIRYPKNCRYKSIEVEPLSTPRCKRPLISRAFPRAAEALIGWECVLRTLRVSQSNEHPKCPTCRRWRSVVWLADGSLRCTKCKREWRLKPK
jgi:hypothetical protein